MPPRTTPSRARRKYTQTTFPDSWGQLGRYSPQTEDEQDNAVYELLGEEGYQALHKDTDDPEIYTARKTFAKFLHDNQNNFPKTDNINERTILMEEFLGKEGLELYQKAIEEESKSSSFRNAVFLASHKHYQGPKWEKTKCIHIGGPSGSGKSHAKDAIVNFITEHEQGASLEAITENKGNDVIFVDGGIDRKVSQMRSITLAMIFANGFQGGEDLHEKSKKTAVKKYVQNAALKSKKDFNLAIPDTFTNPKHIAKFLKFKEYDKDQIFVSIKASQTQTLVSGNARAWRRGKTPYAKENIHFNQEHEAESKIYEPSYFTLGEKFTKAALEFFEKIIGGNSYVVTNDILHLKASANGPFGYEICTETDTHFDVRANKRVYQDWLDYRQQNQRNSLSLEEWIENLYLKKNTLNQWVLCSKEEFDKAKNAEDKVSLPRYQYISWKESSNPPSLQEWTQIQNKKFGIQVMEKVSRRPTKTQRETDEQSFYPSKKLRRTDTEVLRERSPSRFRKVTGYLGFSPEPPAKVLTTSHIGIGDVASKLDNSKEKKKYGIQNIDKSKLDSAATLTLTMQEIEDKSNVKKVYLENVHEGGGIRYSIDKITPQRETDEEKKKADEKKRRMMKQIIQMAVDNALPGSEFIIHRSVDQKIVEEILKEILGKRYADNYVFENDRFRMK